MAHIRLHRLVLILLILAALSPTSRADMLAHAQDYLGIVGVPVPEGYTVRWGTDTAGGAPGEVKPGNPNDVSQGGVIVINPEGIKRLTPNLPGEPGQFGGVIVVVLYHEIEHADGSYGGDLCSEVRLQKQTAEKHCELVCFILDELPFADVRPLCVLYSDAQNRYNNGVSIPGSASTAWAKAGCAEQYPGDIPSCACCN